MVNSPAKSASSVQKKAAVPAAHPTYKDMVSQAIVNLKERNGSSRIAIKKYVHANFKALSSTADSLINQAIKKGVAAGVFVQPKGPSGPVKLGKVEKKKPAPKPKKVKKVTKPKKAAPKKAADSEAKKPAVKKTTKKVAASPKKTTAKAKVALKKAGKKTAASPKKKAAVAKPAKKVAAAKKATTKKVAPKKN